MKESLPVLGGGIAPLPYVRLPRVREVFRRRAERLRLLARGHPAGDWLQALATIGEAQDAAVDCEGRPSALVRILEQLVRAPLPDPARDAIARLRSGHVDSTKDPAELPFVAAALQVHHAKLAERRSPAEIPRAERDCPVCHAPAVAGIVGGDDRARYLHCSLCASSWHRTRVQCATCGEPGRLTYFVIEAAALAGVKAEACSACRTYLKLFYQEERPGADAFADDLATIALDLLLGERGFARGGANPFLA